MRSLEEMLDIAPVYAGVGGPLMEEEGLAQPFSPERRCCDGADRGDFSAANNNVKRVHQTVDAVISFAPDVVVVIDSPEFTHAIAKRVRRKSSRHPHYQLCVSKCLGMAFLTRQKNESLY